MRNSEVERRLRQGFADVAPDDFPAVRLRLPRQKEGGLQMAGKENTTKRRRPGLAIAMAALALVLVIGGATGVALYSRGHSVASIVSVDVNPSVELRANKAGKVLRCVPLNSDAAELLSDMNGGKDLEGTTLPVAVNAVVGSLLRAGYLDGLSSAILLSVEDKDAERAARLQQELVSAVDGVLKSASNNASVLSQSLGSDKGLDSRAEQNNISSGKAYLVDRVIEKNPSLDYSALAALTVEELRDMLKTGAGKMPIGCDAAVSAAMKYAGLEGNSSVTADADPELDEAAPHYDVDLYYGGAEYEYRVDAYSGEVLEGQPNVGGSGTASVPAAPSRPGTSSQPGTSSKPSGGTSAGNGDIGTEGAKAAALKHAGLSEGEVTRMKVERDYERGRLVYEVEFSKGRVEYEYVIDAATGAVLEHDRDYDD